MKISYTDPLFSRIYRPVEEFFRVTKIFIDSVHSNLGFRKIIFESENWQFCLAKFSGFRNLHDSHMINYIKYFGGQL